MAQTGDSGTITIHWTLVARDESGKPEFSWSVTPSRPSLSDDDVEALLQEIAKRL